MKKQTEARLTEYCSAPITAAMTGKIDVLQVKLAARGEGDTHH